ncbi:hypothetical protein V6O07_03295, partial [Arthrospira platensis SPKY2]
MEIFDLTSRIEQIIGDQTGLTVTFHLTFAQAQAGTNAIANPAAFANTANAQTLHVRVTNTDTGCFSTTLLDVRVEPLPLLNLPTVIPSLCDGNQDGFAVFNLEDLAEDLLNGATDITLSFYATAQNAEDGVNPLPTLYENIIPFVDFVFIRAEDVDTGCFRVYIIELNIF